MKCYKCNREIKNVSAFCPFCGSELNNITTNLNREYSDNISESNYQTVEKTESAGLSIASMVCGICSLVFVCSICLSVILAIVGIALGYSSRKHHKKGAKMAKAGIITSIVALGLIVLTIISYSLHPSYSNDLYNLYK